MKRYILFLLISVLSVITCNQSPEDKNVQEISREFSHRTSNWGNKVSTLQENMVSTGKITAFDMCNAEQFLIATTNLVVLYNKNGKQLRVIGSKGKGPFQYIAPRIVRYENDNVYIWCARLTRLVVFHIDGTPIDSYSFSRAINNFAVFGDMIVFYTSGGFDAPVIKIYNLQERKWMQSYAQKSNTHKILNTRNCSGALTNDAKNLYFAKNDELTVFKVLLADSSLQTTSVKDADFHVQHVHMKPGEFIQDRDKAGNFFRENSLNTGIYVTQNLLVLRAQLGKATANRHEEDIGIISKYYVFDKALSLKHTVKLQAAGDSDITTCLQSANRDHIYSLRINPKKKTYELFRLPIRKQHLE